MKKCILIDIENSVNIYTKKSSGYSLEKSANIQKIGDEKFYNWLDGTIDIENFEFFVFSDNKDLVLNNPIFKDVEKTIISKFEIEEIFKNIFKEDKIEKIDNENVHIIKNFTKDFLILNLIYPKEIEISNSINKIQEETQNSEKSFLKLFFEDLIKD